MSDCSKVYIWLHFSSVWVWWGQVQFSLYEYCLGIVRLRTLLGWYILSTLKFWGLFSFQIFILPFSILYLFWNSNCTCVSLLIISIRCQVLYSVCFPIFYLKVLSVWILFYWPTSVVTFLLLYLRCFFFFFQLGYFSMDLRQGITHFFFCCSNLLSESSEYIISHNAVFHFYYALVPF